VGVFPYGDKPLYYGHYIPKTSTLSRKFYRTGHPFPDGPIFGIAPCPMAMFTFGMFLQTQGRFPIKLIIIPLLWSLTGFFALTVFELYASGGQLIIGVMGTLLILYRNRRIEANTVGTDREN